MADINLDELLPDEKTIKFKAKSERDENGKRKEYELTLFISTAAGILIAENMNQLSEIIPTGKRIPNLSKDNINLVFRVIEEIFKRQYKYMNREWIENNVSFSHLIIILINLIKPIYNYINEMNLPLE